MSSYVAGLDRAVICANTGVTLRDTTIIGADRARRDSAALAERNCEARYEVARQGRSNLVFIPLAVLLLLSSLVAGLVTLRWALGRIRRRADM